MLRKLAGSVTFLLKKNRIIEKEDSEIYSYGLELLISNGITLLAIVSTGAILNKLDLTFIFLLVFCGLRIFTGGYHAKSFWGCFLISNITYLVIMIGSLLVASLIQGELGLLFTFVSLLVIYNFAPVEHQNKLKSDSDILKNRAFSRHISIYVLGICLLMYTLGGVFEKYVFVIGCSLLAVAINIVVSLNNKGGEKNE